MNKDSIPFIVEDICNWLTQNTIECKKSKCCKKYKKKGQACKKCPKFS